MNIKQQNILQKYNHLLSDNKQHIQIDEYSAIYIRFNNGLILSNRNEIVLFRQRLYSDTFVSIIDDIYTENGINVSLLKKIKSHQASKGGKECQSIHGSKIRNNLNTGEPWNKNKTGLQQAWNKGLTKKTNESLKCLSEQRKGKMNPMYGVPVSKEKRKTVSDLMKMKIENGEFTPNIHNSRTHWVCQYNGQKYRSSWEVVWHYLNPDYEYESLRIPYIYKNNKKIYIVDFVNHTTKHVVELKPSCHHDNSITKTKIASAIEWCNNNGYVFDIIDENFIVDNWDIMDLSLFDEHIMEKITKAYETCIKKEDR